MNKIQLNDINYKIFSKGVEGIVYSYDENILLKYFRDEELETQIDNLFNKYGDLDWYNTNKGKVIDKNTLENKRKKLEIIKDLKCLSNEVKLLDLAYKDDEFKGYTMEKLQYKPIDIHERKSKKINYLKMIREKIRLLNENDIYICDFKADNFLVSKDGKDIKLCDLDNLYLKDFNLKNDTEHRFTQYFNKNCNKKEYVDSFCFNLFTLAYLKKIAHEALDPRLDKLPWALNTKENRDIMDSIINLDNSYEPRYLIDNLR